MGWIRDPEKAYPGSGVKKHRIPDPDPQYCHLQDVYPRKKSEKLIFRHLGSSFPNI
jgi:hypothetical protein